MKKYYYLVISFISIICLAPSKNKKTSSPQVPQDDQHRINIISKKNILWQKIDEINQFVPSEKEFELKKQLKQYSLEELSEEYIQWCKTLSKTEMLKILYREDQLYRGFNQEDALRVVDRLKYKRPSAIYDIFMQYQKKFILPEVNFEKRTREDRINQLHGAYEQEYNNQSLFRQLPFVHNIESSVLPVFLDITKMTDSDLYEKIAEEMKRAGFSQAIIDEELANLKKEPVETLQGQYPHLETELANRLMYFHGVRQNRSKTIVSADEYLKLMHTWLTTAASVVVSGASLFGLNTAAMQKIVGSTILDPYIGQKQHISKRQMLAMIYAQYKSYDAVRDMYINPSLQEIELLTKNEILDSIAASMKEMDFSSDFIEEKLNEYTNVSKDELILISQEFKAFTKNKILLNASEEEKKIATYTRSVMIDKITEIIEKSSESEDAKNEFLAHLDSANSSYLRFTLLDLIQQETTVKNSLEIKIPENSYTENFILHYSPYLISQAIKEPVIKHVKKGWENDEKSQANQFWREQNLRSGLEKEQEGIFEHLLDLKTRVDVATSMGNLIK